MASETESRWIGDGNDDNNDNDDHDDGNVDDQ